MNIELVPKYILDDFNQRGLSVAQIEQSTPEKLFHEYCNWHGLIGWGYSLVTVLDALREADNH